MNRYPTTIRFDVGKIIHFGQKLLNIQLCHGIKYATWDAFTLLDNIVDLHVPAPIVTLHVAEGSIDTSLCSHCVGACGKQFGDDGGFEALRHQPEGGTKPGSARTNHHCIVLVVDHRVFSGDLPDNTTKVRM